MQHEILKSQRPRSFLSQKKTPPSTISDISPLILDYSAVRTEYHGKINLGNISARGFVRLYGQSCFQTFENLYQ